MEAGVEGFTEDDSGKKRNRNICDAAEEERDMGTVLWPDIIKVSCCFTDTTTGGVHGSYQIYWNTPEEPGPYMVQLLTGTEVLVQKRQVYGTAASLEAEIPEADKRNCSIAVFPEGREVRDLLPVPGAPVCRLQEIICGESQESGLCKALQLRYAMDNIVPEKIMVQLRLADGRIRLIPLGLYESRISLESLGIEGEESIQLGMGCVYKEQNTVIEQEPAEESFVEVYRKAPVLTGMSVEVGESVSTITDLPVRVQGQQAGFRICLDQAGTGSYMAVISCAGAKVKAEARLSEDKMSLAVQLPLADFPYGLEQSYLLSVIRKDGMVTSPESEKLAVNLQIPAVETLQRIKKDTFRLRLSGQAVGRPQICRAFLKDADGKREAIDFTGSELEYTFAAWESVSLAWVNGKSTGPETESFDLKIPVYLSGEDKNGHPFIYYAGDAAAEPGGMIRVEVPVKAVLENQVLSGVFTLLPPEETKTEGVVLEMADTVWPDHQEYDGEKIKSDWLALLKAAETAGFDAEDLRELRRTVAARLPQKSDVEEQAFYHFDMRRRQCGLFPGMALLVESGRMQWSDDSKGSGYFAGISGAEQVRIPVVCRDGKTGLDAFLWLLKNYTQRFEQPAYDNLGRLPGGAGTVDLGRHMLRQNHLIVHYPDNFISHCAQGEVRACNNEYLAAAESLEIMERDIRLMEEDGYLSDVREGGQAYFVFLRGRVHMTPCFAIRMEGREYWVTVGTTVGDMMDRLGQSFSLLRDGVRAEMPLVDRQALREICLAPGDSLMMKA